MKTIQVTKKSDIVNDNIIVECKRVAYNPCALDEYEVTIKPDSKPEQVINTFSGLFDGNDEICGRVYRQWLKSQSK